MKLSTKNGQIILLDQTDGGDAPGGAAVMAALAALAGHAVEVQVRSPVCIVLEDLGPRAEACREPINITRSVDRRYVAISNLYPTPFRLDDVDYASVEGFWQSLKCTDPDRRRRVAGLSGTEAKKAAGKNPPALAFEYGGETIVTGTHAHWGLMERACAAKFAQHREARAALLATGTRPLTHIVRGDSRTIPGVVMAAIWMGIRNQMMAKNLE